MIKKISLKIDLFNIIMFIVIFGLFFLISIRQLSNVIEINIRGNIIEQVKSLEDEFNSLIETRRLLTLPMKTYLEDQLTLEILKDDELSKEIFNQTNSFSIPVVRSENLLNIYCWLDPEVNNNFFGISIKNYKLDGNTEIYYPEPYTKEKANSEGWQWFWGPKDTGTYISKPYDWEGIDGKVIAYTESLIVDGKFAGIIGTDFKVGEFQKRLLSKKILDTGYFAMADENLKFIFHNEYADKHISELFTDITEEELNKIKSSQNEFGYIRVSDNNNKQIISYKKLSNGWFILGLPTTSEVYETLNKSVMFMIIVSIIALILILFISILLGRAISSPVKNVADSLSEISEGGGDLTKNIFVKTEDETRLLADSFNKFISNLKGIVFNIKSSSNKNASISVALYSSSTSASTAALEITKNTESISKQIYNLNNNIQETTSGIEEISSNITQFKGQIDEQVSAVEQSSASIEEIIASLDNVAGVTNKKLESTKVLVKITNKGQTLLRETSEVFKEGIADRIGSIRDMVNVISGISDKTNLLAMNAAIEAAHAGEAGKGFSVVADEIRKMAEESSLSAKNISDIINVIVDAIVNTDSKVDNTSVAFNEIINEVKEIDRALNEIASNTIELASGGQEILTSVSLLNNTTTNIASGIKEIEIGADNIKDSMLNIQNISVEVKEGVEEINTGINYVSNSFEEVATLSSDLDEETRKLLTEVDKFIIE